LNLNRLEELRPKSRLGARCSLSSRTSWRLFADA
jgi:hypothetical protein